jgi:post-segregation antitoxin (ccd killing protein)
MIVESSPGFGSAPMVCMLRRMPRMQIYLPADLYQAVKKRHLPASELLQQAVRSEVRRRELEAASRKYTAELAAEVGEPSPRQRARAAGIARRIGGRFQRKAG